MSFEAWFILAVVVGVLLCGWLTARLRRRR